MRTFFIIVDVYTARKKTAIVWDKIQHSLDKQQVNYSVVKVRPKIAAHITEKFIRTTSPQQLADCVIMAIGQHDLMLDTIKGIKNAGKVDLPIAFISTAQHDPFMQKIGVSSDPLSALQQILNAVRPVYFNLGQVNEPTHDSRRFFTDELNIGFNAYVANTLANSRFHRLLTRFHLSYLSKLWNKLTAYINQESFEVTMRINQKYNFYKHTFNVTIKNEPYLSQQRSLSSVKHPTLNNNLQVELISNMNLLFYFLLLITRKLKIQHKLPFVHNYASNQVHLVIKSLEFGQVDHHQMNNKFYDVFFKSFSYPFWYDIDSIPLADMSQKQLPKKSSKN
ncbi:hypothetical protein [Liquorilactobacillus capillatus]|uniref:Transcription regulator n=1 Tax=Liquorilactobacillus capillatus DSM 19910 TaxID=1423731 RepID=A0A0R1M0E8_9LACO|nr:hypothetical protein [Liquorilactobacillus capillatus]KRL01399.1 transcription regulator [Liquorilactobacillus capillatus DSM 19910]